MCWLVQNVCNVHVFNLMISVTYFIKKMKIFGNFSLTINIILLGILLVVTKRYKCFTKTYTSLIPLGEILLVINK